MTARIDRDEVLAALRVTDVLDRFAVEGRRVAAYQRSRTCPKCGDHARHPHVSIRLADGMWTANRCRHKGNLLQLVAALAGLDCDRDFGKVLELAADIAGVRPGESEDVIAARRASRERQDRERAAAAAAEQAAARAAMPAAWYRLARRHDQGEAYLRERGLDPRALGRRDVVRYSRTGCPALALRDLETGALTGIQFRLLDGPTKMIVEPGSQVAGAALFGRVAELDPGGVDVAVIVEGLADTLAGVLAWPACAVYGAPGTAQMPAVARSVARRIAEVRGRLWIAVDDDSAKGHDAGVEAAAKAIREAQAAGLELGRDLHVVEIGAHHDVADAYKAGWRPAAP